MHELNPATKEFLRPKHEPQPAQILSNNHAQSAFPVSGWRCALFGVPFFVGGIACGFRAIVSPDGNAPKWVVVMCCGIFFFIGLFLLIHGLRDEVIKTRYLRGVALQPGQPGLHDYRWSPEGIGFSAFNVMLQRLLAALIWTVFLIPFFWWGFTEIHGDKFILLISSIFAICSLYFWRRWAQKLADWLRYGNTFLNYDCFPYFLGGKLSVRLSSPRNLSELEALSLILRCVQERYVTSAGDGSTVLVRYELYKEVIAITRDRLSSFSGGDIPAEFFLPADQPSTSLALKPPTYWEIEACGESRKIDFQAYFLVPVYKA